MKNKNLSNSEMPAEHRRILSLAALFHKDFLLDWIAGLSANKASSVLVILEELVRAGQLTSKRPGIYRFTKEEERQAILNQLSPDETSACHQRIIHLLMAEPLEDDEKAVYLHPHLLEVQNDLVGCGWLKRAGDVFRKTSLPEQARGCYQKVIESLSSLHGDNADYLFIETAICYSKVFMAAEETSKIIAILENALDKIKDNDGYLGQKALLKMELAKNEWLRDRHHIAIQYFQEGKAIAEKTNNESILRKTALYNIYYYFWQGRIKDVINEYENYQPQITNFPKNQLLLKTVGLAAQAYAHAGQMNQAMGIAKSLLHYAKGSGDHYTRCHALGILSIIMFYMGKIEQAFQYRIQSLELSKQVHINWLTYHAELGIAHLNYLRGDHDQAVSSLRKFDRLRKKMQVYVPVLPLALMEICWAMESGKLNYKAAFSMRSTIQQALQGENLFNKGLAYRYEAFMKEREGASHEEIFKNLHFSVNWLEAAGAKIEMAKSQLEIARRLFFLEDVKKAREITVTVSRILADINPDLIPKELKNLIGEDASLQNTALDEILKLGQEIANIRESRALALKIISAINYLTRAERGAIFILENGDLRFKASQNLTKPQTLDPEFAFSMNVIREVVRTGRGCIRVMGAGNHSVPSLPDSTIIRSIICVPMVLRGQVSGVLYHDNCFISTAFKHADLELLAYFAAMAAVSFENVSYYERMQLLNQKISQEKEHFEEQYLNHMHWGNIIGNSPTIKNVMSKIHKVAKTDSNVLIVGETGSGKELVANAIHQNSLRHDGPFIVVQCGALPESLIQSELLGHEKGSFTGAIKRRLGRMELANGGTLFLDEIGDISLEVQVLLLRVLQTKRFERLGGNETLQSDFRLIAATNRDLEQAVQEGRFRADLYYRLNVFLIHVPPLRDRKEDIPLLAKHFLMMHSKKLGKDYREIHEKALSSLIKYDWPGNIRELENILERAMILDQPPLLRIVDLPPSAQHRRSLNASLPEGDSVTLSENERRHIIAVLKQTEWRITGAGGASELLKINPSTLRFRIKKLGIKKPQVEKNKNIRLNS